MEIESIFWEFFILMLMCCAFNLIGLIPQMRVLCMVFNAMGWRTVKWEGHMSSMRVGRISRWEDGTSSTAGVKVERVIGLSIYQKIGSARVGDHPSATILIAMLMAGEDRGRGARLYNCSGCSEMLLCLMLFRIILGIGSAEVFGGSGSECSIRIGSGEKESFAAEGGCRGGDRRVIPAEIQVGSGTLADAGNFIKVNCGLQPALDYFHLVVYTFGPAMTRPRQRLLSRRGSGRGNTSCPSTGSGSKEQVPDPLRSENVIRPGQFLNPSSPGSTGSSSFGSATFTFNCALSRPRITAHVSVLFLEETQDEGEPSITLPHSTGPPAAMHHGISKPASAQAQMEGMEGTEIDDRGCRIVEELPEDEGGCRIVEESP